MIGGFAPDYCQAEPVASPLWGEALQGLYHLFCTTTQTNLEKNQTMGLTHMQIKELLDEIRLDVFLVLFGYIL